MFFPKQYPVRPSVRCKQVICGLERTNIEPRMLGDHLITGEVAIMQSGQGAVVASASSDVDVQELTRRRAEEIYIRSGRIPGRDVENWRQAEAEIRAELDQASRRTAIVVRVSGVQYVGEYSRDDADGYTPGEFTPGVPVPVRLRGDKMFIRRPNGKILETRIVKQVE